MINIVIVIFVKNAKLLLQIYLKNKEINHSYYVKIVSLDSSKLCIKFLKIEIILLSL